MTIRNNIPNAKPAFGSPKKKRIDLIEPEVFDRLLLACRPKGESGASLDRVVARNRSILWVLMDTGMRVSDLVGCASHTISQSVAKEKVTPTSCATSIQSRRSFCAAPLILLTALS